MTLAASSTLSDRRNRRRGSGVGRRPPRVYPSSFEARPGVRNCQSLVCRPGLHLALPARAAILTVTKDAVPVKDIVSRSSSNELFQSCSSTRVEEVLASTASGLRCADQQARVSCESASGECTQHRAVCNLLSYSAAAIKSCNGVVFLAFVWSCYCRRVRLQS